MNSTSTASAVTLGEEPMKEVSTYLGSVVETHDGTEADVKAMIGKAIAVFLHLMDICNSEIVSLKIRKSRSRFLVRMQRVSYLWGRASQ